MKNILKIALVPVLVILLLTQCNKADNSKIFNANFYTTTATTKVYLYLDDVYKGELPYFATTPSCRAFDGDGYGPLSFQLPSGEYHLVGKDAQGEIVSESTIKISRNKMHVSGRLGGSGLSSNDDCLMIGVWK